MLRDYLNGIRTHAFSATYLDHSSYCAVEYLICGQDVTLKILILTCSNQAENVVLYFLYSGY